MLSRTDRKAGKSAASTSEFQTGVIKIRTRLEGMYFSKGGRRGETRGKMKGLMAQISLYQAFRRIKFFRKIISIIFDLYQKKLYLPDINLNQYFFY